MVRNAPPSTDRAADTATKAERGIMPNATPTNAEPFPVLPEWAAARSKAAAYAPTSASVTRR